VTLIVVLAPAAMTIGVVKVTENGVVATRPEIVFGDEPVFCTVIGRVTGTRVAWSPNANGLATVSS
jgi:hypothetical protein